MKKIICFVLCLLALSATCSCSIFEGNSDSEETVKLETTSARQTMITKDELEKAVGENKILGGSLALGCPIDEAKEYFLNIVQPETTTAPAAPTKIRKKGGTTKVVTVQTTATTEPNPVTVIGEDEKYYEYYEGNSLTSVAYDTETLFYVNDNLESGAAFIVNSGTAFNFIAGNCPSADLVNSIGKPDVMDYPTQDQLFFCIGTPMSPVRYTYNFDNKRVDFIFENDNLLVTVLTDTTVYGGFTTCDTTTVASATAAVTTIGSTFSGE